MKYAQNRSVKTSLWLGAFLSAGLSMASAQSPDVPKTEKPAVTPPAISDGSNASRAPVPSALPQGDLKAPDGQAIDRPKSADTTATTTRQTAVPAPRIRVQTQPVPQAVAPGAGEPMLTPTGRTATAVTSSLDSVKIAPTIRATTLTSREPVLLDIESRIASTDTAMASYNASMSEMNDESRKQFKMVASEVKERGKALKKSLQNARTATEQDWDRARSQLASDYESYAAALARVDALTGVAPAVRP